MWKSVVQEGDSGGACTNCLSCPAKEGLMFGRCHQVTDGFCDDPFSGTTGAGANKYPREASADGNG